MPEYLSYKQNGWAGLVLSEAAGCFPDLMALKDAGQTVVANHLREVYRIDSPAGKAYFKCLYRIRKQTPLLKKLTEWMKFCFRGPRSLAVLRLTDALLSAGVGCPQTLLAARCKAGSSLSEIIISREIPWPTVRTLLEQASCDGTRKEILLQTARGLKRFHQLGFVHGDCLPGNLCLSPEGKLYFLDNDRSGRACPLWRKRAQQRNLIQFCSHAWRTGGTDAEKLCRYFLESCCGPDRQDEVKYILKLWRRRQSELAGERQRKLNRENPHA